MKPIEKPITVTTVLITTAIAAGVFIRFANLGQNALDANEANLALQAYNTVHSQYAVWSGQPIYLLLTSALLAMFRDSNFLVRLVPALFGSAFLVVPLFFRDRLKPGVLILFTWLLALDPSLIAASRTVGGWMISLTLLGFLSAAVYHQKYWGSAVLAALCLVSGPTLWPILLIAAVSLFIWTRVSQDNTIHLPDFLKNSTQSFWIVFGVSLAAFTGLLFSAPNGIGALGGSISDFLEYFVSAQPYSLLLVLLAIPLYSPILLVAGTLQGLRAVKIRDQHDILAGIFFLVGLLIIVLLPGREPLMITWVIVPLAYLATTGVEKVLSYASEDFKQPALISGFVVLILLFLWQVFGSINQGRLEMNQFLLYTGAGIGILLVCAILAIMGWSLKVTGIGYAWGFLLVFSLFSISAAWRSTGQATLSNREFWNFGNTPSQVVLVEKTINEVSSTVRGVPNGLDISVLGNITPALQWQLRHQVMYSVLSVSYQEPPAIVISPMDTGLDPNIFRGQDFVLRTNIDWSALTVQDWLKWTMIRVVPSADVEDCIVWVRWDLFPGYRPTNVPAE